MADNDDKTPPSDIDDLIGHVGVFVFNSWPEDDPAARFASLYPEEAKSMPTTDESEKKKSGK